MARLRLLSAVMAGLCLLGPRAQAACFDFSQRVTQPLVDAPALREEGGGDEVRASGDLADGLVWAALHGVIRLPLPYLLAVIKDHRAINDPRIDAMQIKEIDNPNGLLHQRILFTSHPIRIVTIEWIEDWVYTLLSGTNENPQKVLISFQKSSGTHHIQQLCGNIVLERRGDHATDVYVYQRIKATRQTRELTLQQLERVFTGLRRRSLAVEGGRPEQPHEARARGFSGPVFPGSSLDLSS